MSHTTDSHTVEEVITPKEHAETRLANAMFGGPPPVHEEQIEPLQDRVVILPDEPEGMSKGGILYPEVSKKIPVRGTVVAVGPGHRTEATGILIPTTLKIGDRVLYSHYSGETVKCGNTEYKILRERDVSAKLGATRQVPAKP